MNRMPPVGIRIPDLSPHAIKVESERVTLCCPSSSSILLQKVFQETLCTPYTDPAKHQLQDRVRHQISSPSVILWTIPRSRRLNSTLPTSRTWCCAFLSWLAMLSLSDAIHVVEDHRRSLSRPSRLQRPCHNVCLVPVKLYINIFNYCPGHGHLRHRLRLCQAPPYLPRHHVLFVSSVSTLAIILILAIVLFKLFKIYHLVYI